MRTTHLTFIVDENSMMKKVMITVYYKNFMGKLGNRVLVKLDGWM